MVIQRKYIRRAECECCGATEDLTSDHIIPKCFGGKELQTLCKRCNLDKGILTINYKTKTLTIDPWMLSLNEPGLIKLFTDRDFGQNYLFVKTFKNERKRFKRRRQKLQRV